MNDNKDIKIINFENNNKSQIKTGNICSTYTNNNTYNIYHEHLTEYNLKSPPIDPKLNSNNRTLLKNKINKRIQIWAYAIGEYGYLKAKNIMRYTIINVHNKDNFIADHIQLDIPYDLYKKIQNYGNISHKIIWVDGIVYRYDSKYGEKQSITAININISNVNNMIINEEFIKPIQYINGRKLDDTLIKVSKFSSNKKFKLMKKAINELNSIIAGMPKDFIANYIINQYTINFDPYSIYKGNYGILINDDISILEITFLILSLYKKISEKSIKSMYDVFKYINWILNSMQGFSKNDIIDNKNCNAYKYPSKEFKKFCKKHNIKIKKAKDYILLRNMDFDGKVLYKEDAYNNALQVIYSDMIEEDICYNNLALYIDID